MILLNRTQNRWIRYSSYSNSDIEGLEEFPEQWEVRRLKHVLELRNGEAPPPDIDIKEGDFPVYGANGIMGYCSRFNVSKRAITIGRVGSIGEINILREKAWVSDNALIATLDESLLDFDFGVFLLKAMNFLEQASRNVQPLITGDMVKNLYFARPPYSEQRIIAAFLNRETSRMNLLIEKKGQLIELLQEKRTALISHSVTKGLSNVTMKDSNVPAIGQIPVHWEVKRNKRIFEEVNERSISGKEELLTVSHISGVIPRSEKEVYMFMAESMKGYKVCRPNDLIINTMWAWMGALGISKHFGIVSPSYNVYRFRKRDEFVPEYLDLLYRTPPYACEIGRHSKGIWKSRLRLYPDSFFEMYSLNPPLSEQREIVDHITRETLLLDNLIEKLRKSIGILEEYRNTLISEAVTGKIDIRNECEAHTCQ